MKSVTVLKLKITSPVDELQSVAELCRRARNACYEDWLLRKRGKPEMHKQINPKSEDGKMYHAATACAPELDTQVGSAVAGDVWKVLKAKIPWNKQEAGSDEKVRKYDKILTHEYRHPDFRALSIPLHNKTTDLYFEDGRLTIKCRPKKGESMTVELSLRDVPRAIQKILREIASGERRLPCSTISLYREKWYWSATIEHETEPLNSDLVATLHATIGNPQGYQNDRPFVLRIPGNNRPWYCGHGRYLRAMVSRLVGIRKQVGWRYRLRMGAGHGRKKVDDAVKRRRQQEFNVKGEFRRQLIVDIVRQCERNGVGKLVYHEPVAYFRRSCWFEHEKLEFDWTRFCNDLKNAAARRGIVVEIKRYKRENAEKDGLLPKKRESESAKTEDAA